MMISLEPDELAMLGGDECSCQQLPHASRCGKEGQVLLRGKLCPEKVSEGGNEDKGDKAV